MTLFHSPGPLIIYEMANNHMGNLAHGLEIIDEYGKLAENYSFDFAFKFQFRDIPTFIHPDYQNRLDIKYVKRFSETVLDQKQFSILFARVRALGMQVIVTPFDETSVDMATDLGVDVLKVASCSFTDWPLLENY